MVVASGGGDANGCGDANGVDASGGDDVSGVNIIEIKETAMVGGGYNFDTLFPWYYCLNDES